MGITLPVRSAGVMLCPGSMQSLRGAVLFALCTVVSGMQHYSITSAYGSKDSGFSKQQQFLFSDSEDVGEIYRSYTMQFTNTRRLLQVQPLGTVTEEPDVLETHSEGGSLVTTSDDHECFGIPGLYLRVRSVTTWRL